MELALSVSLGLLYSVSFQRAGEQHRAALLPRRLAVLPCFALNLASFQGTAQRRSGLKLKTL